MESDFNGSSLGQMIVDKVNQTYPGYEMTVQVRKADGVKCVELREIMRLGNKLPLSLTTDATWGNGQNLTTKIRNIIKTKPSDDPLHAICKKIEKHWDKGSGTALVELEKGMPIIIMQLSKLSLTNDKIIKDLSAFIREKRGEVDEEEEENVPPPDEPRMDEPRMDEAPVDEPSMEDPTSTKLSEDECKIMEIVKRDVPTDKLVAAMTALTIELDRTKPVNMLRLRVTNDYKMSAIDVIRIVYEHTDDGASAGKVFARLDQDVKDLFKERVQFDGAHQNATPVGGIKSIIYMVLHLNSKRAKDFKKFVTNLVTNYFANTQGPFQKAAQAEQGQGAGPMEIEDDPICTTLQKKSKVAEGVFGFLETMRKIDPSIKATPQVITMLNEWQTSMVAEALGIKPIPQPKPMTSPKPAAMQQHNVDEDEEMEMEMDDGNEEQSAGAPPQPSGAAPSINVGNMITVDIWLNENNHVVEKKQAQRVGNITSDLVKKKFPNEWRVKKAVDSSPYEHRHYPRSQAWIIEEAYKTMMKEEEEKAARQQAPSAPAPARKPPPATQEDLNRFLNGRKGQ